MVESGFRHLQAREIKEERMIVEEKRVSRGIEKKESG